MKNWIKILYMGLATVLGVNVAAMITRFFDAPSGEKPDMDFGSIFMGLFTKTGLIMVAIAGLLYQLMSKVFGKRNLTPD